MLNISSKFTAERVVLLPHKIETTGTDTFFQVLLTQFNHLEDKREMNEGQEYGIKLVKAGGEATEPLEPSEHRRWPSFCLWYMARSYSQGGSQGTTGIYRGSSDSW
uniref:Uncharacterized protein n=1 Tax=Candidatus Nitrotoga fabula TaxID=2182327 RepID=A0A2X0SE31_9PROT|nr:protein of unknown function [Candidatus Nitrotoga fabula]